MTSGLSIRLGKQPLLTDASDRGYSLSRFSPTVYMHRTFPSPVTTRAKHRHDRSPMSFEVGQVRPPSLLTQIILSAPPGSVDARPRDTRRAAHPNGCHRLSRAEPVLCGRAGPVQCPASRAPLHTVAPAPARWRRRPIGDEIRREQQPHRDWVRRRFLREAIAKRVDGQLAPPTSLGRWGSQAVGTIVAFTHSIAITLRIASATPASDSG